MTVRLCTLAHAEPRFTECYADSATPQRSKSFDGIISYKRR